MEPRRLPGRGARPLRRCATPPINALGGSSESDAFEGGMIPNQNWYAPSLTSNREAGLGDWSIKDITDLLQTGVSHRGAVYGPMAEVVHNSLQYLNDEDTARDGGLPEGHRARPSPPTSQRAAADDREQPADQPGKTVYDKQCASCHGARGRRQAAALSAARRQPVDPDAVGGQPDPHGAQWRLSAGHDGQSAAATACRRSRTSCPTTRSPPW